MGTAARSLPERVVLVVDDEDMVCRYTARVLAEAGFRVLEAHSAAEAVSLLSALDDQQRQAIVRAMATIEQATRRRWRTA